MSGELSPLHDSLSGSDFIRDELRDHSACRTCGSREPVRLGTVDGVPRCSDCYDGWLRCAICRRWIVEDGSSVRVNLDGRLGELCSYCQDRFHEATA